MNYKNILFFFILSLVNQSFAMDDIFNLEFIKLCNAKIETEQRQSAMILKSMLNRSNYLDVINWLCSKECNGACPVVYAVAKENLFIAEALVDYATYDPNKKRPFSYTGGSVSEHIRIAEKCYDPLIIEWKFLQQCSLGNTKFVTFLCSFFYRCLSKDILIEGIIKATESGQKEVLPIIINFSRRSI